MLKVSKITKVFRPERRHRRSNSHPITAVEDLSFEVEQGEFVVLLGPSGCGKTTVLRIIAGLEEPTSGESFFNGARITGPGRDRGMVFQAYSSFPWLTVRENIKFGLAFREGLSQASWDDVARHYIDLVGLGGFEDYYIGELSGGMQQRVALARTLAADPDMLLLDEPFGALDPQTRELLQLHLVSIRGEFAKTIIFVTHDVEEAVFLADRVIVLTARPARFKEEVRVPFGGERTFDLKATGEFLGVKNELLLLIREEALKIEGAKTLLPREIGAGSRARRRLS